LLAAKMLSAKTAASRILVVSEQCHYSVKKWKLG
jgi:hypothetical protein